ncbi:sulfite exporter TauE/SafE family protein [Pararhizobium arenae]|uniref:sulfite exporter TauE/SafE family protein n=1 Tax=Pararhizobium arenae TaxID=1856850 RepID=UPI00094AE089|nr:sulfite exporter TauE/SafE family protein [Pararhizobium arenae]
MPPITELVYFALAIAAAGVVAGFLAGVFGIGGGAILVPVFYQVFGLLAVPDEVRMQLSLGTSLAIIVPTSIRSFLAHRKRGAVDIDLLKGWIVAVPLGSLMAAGIAGYVSGETLMGVFAVIAILMAVRMFFNRENWRIADDLPGNPVRWIAGVVIGVLSGLMGVGGGVINNIFMTTHGRTIHQAVATSSGLGVLISIPGLIGYIWAGWGAAGLPAFSTGFINWIAVILVIPLTLLVAPLGVRTAHALDRRKLEIGFGIFLTVTALRFFYAMIN